jgi:hypothetical protein
MGMRTVEIFADTRGVSRCKGATCGKRILWAQVVATGRKMCFSDPELPALRTRFSEDRRLIEEVDLGANHWATCPDSKSFGKSKATARVRESEQKGEPPDHRCPIHGCAQVVPYRQLMCAAHWSKVPKDLQKQVYDAWRVAGRSTVDRTRHMDLAREACRIVDNEVRGLF